MSKKRALIAEQPRPTKRLGGKLTVRAISEVKAQRRMLHRGAFSGLGWMGWMDGSPGGVKYKPS